LQDLQQSPVELKFKEILSCIRQKEFAEKNLGSGETESKMQVAVIKLRNNYNYKKKTSFKRFLKINNYH
jgi:hypothetical protein